MKIGIVGPGAIGSFLACLLSDENEVDLIGKVDRDINEIKVIGESYTSGKVNYSDDPSQLIEDDIIIIATKSFDTRSAMSFIEDYISNKSIILTLQNGLNNEEIISEFVGEKRTIGGITSHGVTFIKPGTVKHAGEGDTIIGAYPKGNNKKVEKVSKIFNRSGLKTDISNNILRNIWEKGIINSAINPITALSGIKNGTLLDNDNLRDLMNITVNESCEVGKKYVDLSNSKMIKKTSEVASKTSENISSMLQDIKNEKKTEIEQINGAIIKKGKNKGIETKVNRVLFNLIKFKENEYLQDF